MSEIKSSEEKRKINFSLNYYSDLSALNMLYGRIIRSPKNSGVLKSVSFSKNVPIEIQKRCRIITANDIPGSKKIEMLGVESEILCERNIKYKGEPVALLLCDEEYLLRNLIKSELINVEISNDDESNFVLYEKKLLLQKVSKSESFNEKIFDTIASEPTNHIIEEEWTNRIKSASFKETDGAFATAFDDEIYISTPNHWIGNLEKSISKATNIPIEKIFITRTKVSIQNTNAIVRNEITSTLASIATLLTKRPVKIYLTRDEQEKYIENIAKINIYHKTAINKEGIIIAAQIKINVDIGESNPFSEEIAERLLISALGLYKTDNFNIEANIYSSPKPPQAVKLSAIAMHSFFAIENQIQKIAIETGISPKILKFKNFNTDFELFKELKIEEALSLIVKKLDVEIRKEDFTASKNAVFRAKKEVVENFEPSEFDRKFVAFKMKGQTTNIEDTISPYIQNPKGIGLTFAVEGNGYSKRNLYLKTEIRDDGIFIIDSFPVSDSTWSIWTRTINEQLKINKSMVYVTANVNALDWPDTLCDNISVKTVLLKQCCKEILKGNPEVTVKAFDFNKKSLFFSASFATCMLEIEIDPCTFDIKILSMNIIIDCGKVYNKAIVETAVKLDVQKILSQLVENEILSPKELKIQFIDSEEEPKKIGHLLQSVIPAAFSSALSIALGKTVNSLPITKEGIYNVCKNNDKQ